MAVNTARLAKLEKMKSAFGLDANEQAEYDRLKTEAGSATNGSAPAQAASGSRVNIGPVDREKFERGWSTFGTPPEKDGVYPAICTGVEESNRDKDEIWIGFKSTESRSDGRRLWSGSMNVSLSGTKATVGKIKDACEALGVAYGFDGGNLWIDDPAGRRADCDWQTGKNGKRGINGIYKAGEVKQS